MGTLSHFRTIYHQAFKDCKPEIVVILLKVYSVFCGLMLFLAVYAFFYRALNGFDF